MLSIPIRLGLAFLGALVIALAAKGAPGQEQPLYPELHLGDPFRGGAIYRNRCIECHGEDGEGAMLGAPDLNWKVRLNEAKLLNHVLWGFHGSQRVHEAGPGDDLMVKDVRDVLAFLHNYYHYKSFARRGEAIFNVTCVACHGADGKGVVPGTPDFTKQDGVLTQPHETLVKHVLWGFRSPGSPTAMPPKGANDTLTAEDAQRVLAFVHQKFHWQTYP